MSLKLPLDADGLQRILSTSPAMVFLGLRVLSADPAAQTVVMHAPMRPEWERFAGSRQWHGGPMASVIDTVADFALIMLLGRPVPTINLSVDYLRPAIDTDLLVTARVRRNGRSIGLVDADVANEAGALLAIARGTYATRPETG